jgi:two-component system LytT family response regulator
MPNLDPLRVVLADDERPARQRLEDLLSDAEDVEVVATCKTGRAAVEAIETHDPDLALLDIQMPGLTGLDVVQTIGVEQMPVVIFVTAYDQHALRAFDMAAVDYLLKPFDDDRFADALDRARRYIRLHQVDELRDQLMSVLEATGRSDAAPNDADATAPSESDAAEEYLTRIPVQTNREVRIVPVADVVYFQSDGPYVELHVGDGTPSLIRERMKTLEARLDPKDFCRIHRSTIVNLAYVDSVQPNYNDRYVVRLSTGKRLPVSRRRRPEFEERFGLSL